MKEAASLVLKNNIVELERMAHEVSFWCQQNTFPYELEYELNLALDEVVSNVIRHGYLDQDEHEIFVKLAVDGDQLTVEVEDDAVHFDPLLRSDPDISTPIDERPEGGLGIFMVRQIMDSLDYWRDGTRNYLIMKKRTTKP